MTETLFSSTSGAEVGDQRVTATIVPQKFETVSVPAGTYTALKIIVNANFSETKHGEASFADSSTTLWYAKQVGIVKSYQGFTGTSKGYTITGTALQELTSFTKSVSAVSVDPTMPSNQGMFFGMLWDKSLHKWSVGFRICKKAGYANVTFKSGSSGLFDGLA